MKNWWFMCTHRRRKFPIPRKMKKDTDKANTEKKRKKKRLMSYESELHDLEPHEDLRNTVFSLIPTFNASTDITYCSLHGVDEGGAEEFLKVACDRLKRRRKKKMKEGGKVSELLKDISAIPNVEIKNSDYLKTEDLHTFPYSGMGTGKRNHEMFMFVSSMVDLRHVKLKKHYVALKRIFRDLRRKCDTEELKRRTEKLYSDLTDIYGRITPKLHYSLHYWIFHVLHGPVQNYWGYPGEGMFSFVKRKKQGTGQDRFETLDFFRLKVMLAIVERVLKRTERRVDVPKITTRIRGTRNRYRNCRMFTDSTINFRKGEYVKIFVGENYRHFRIRYFRKEPARVAVRFVATEKPKSRSGDHEKKVGVSTETHVLRLSGGVRLAKVLGFRRGGPRGGYFFAL